MNAYDNDPRVTRRSTGEILVIGVNPRTGEDVVGHVYPVEDGFDVWRGRAWHWRSADEAIHDLIGEPQ